MSTIVRRKTGRSRTLTWTSVLTGYFAEYFSAIPASPTGPDCDGDLLITVLGAAQIEVKRFTNSVFKTICINTFGLGVQVRANDGHGIDSGWQSAIAVTGDVNSGDPTFGCGAPTAVQLTYDWSGTCSFSIDMEEWEEVEYLYTDTDGNHAGPWAQYGGAAAVSDMPPFTVLRYYEQGQIGGSLKATVTVGGATATVNTSITSGISNATRLHDTDYFYLIYGSLTTAYGSSGHLTATHVAQGDSYGVTWSASAGGVTHNSNTGMSITHSVDGNSTLAYSQIVPKTATLLGYLDTMNGTSYPDVAIQVTTQRELSLGLQDIGVVGGVWADSIIQKSYSVQSSRFGFTPYKNDLTPDHHQFIAPSQLINKGEDPTDWRIMHRGPWYQVMTLRQAATYLLFNGSPVGQWTAINAGLAQDGGEVKIIVNTSQANTEGSAAWLPPAPVGNWQNARFLSIFVRCDQANTAFRVRVGHKEWAQDYQGVPLAANTSTTEYILDMCIPTNAAATVDSKESRYPTPTTPSDFWGVTQARVFYNDTTLPGLQLTHLGAGRNFWCGSIRLKILDKATATFLAPKGLMFQATQQNAGAFALRLLTSNVDGREPAIDEHCYLTQAASGNPEYTTIQNLVDHLAASDEYGAGKYLNLTVTPQVIDPAAEPVHNMAQFAAWCMGNGLRVTREGLQVSATAKRAFDLDILTGDLTVYAQVLADFIVWYPGSGDSIGFTTAVPPDGPYSGPIILHPAKIMRAQGIGGIVTDKYLEAPDGTVVNCHETTGDGEAGSTTVSGGRGNYKTIAPYVRGGTGGHVYTNESSSTWPGDTRFRHRRWMRAGIAFGGPWNLELQHGEYARVAESDGVIYIWSTDWSVPQPQWIVEEQIVTEGKNPRITEDDRGLIILVYEKPTNSGFQIWERETIDRGRSWIANSDRAVVVLANTKYPTIATGLLSKARVVAGYLNGNIVGVILHSGDQQYSAPFTFVDQTGQALSVIDTTFHIQEVSDGVARWVLSAVSLNAAGTVAELYEWYSTDFCRTWHRGQHLFDGAKYATVCHGQLSRGTIIAALVNATGDGFHRIHGCFRKSGDVQYSTEFEFMGGNRFLFPGLPFNLIVDEGAFHIQEAADPRAGWVLTASVGGKIWQWSSTDDCRNWQQIVSSS